MNKETNNLIVMRDNEIDLEFRRKQHIEAVQANLGHVVSIVTSPVTNALHNLRTNLTEAIEVKAYDIVHGTDYTLQLREQRQARAQARAAERFGVE